MAELNAEAQAAGAGLTTEGGAFEASSDSVEALSCAGARGLSRVDDECAAAARGWQITSTARTRRATCRRYGGFLG